MPFHDSINLSRWSRARIYLCITVVYAKHEYTVADRLPGLVAVKRTQFRDARERMQAGRNGALSLSSFRALVSSELHSRTFLRTIVKKKKEAEPWSLHRITCIPCAIEREISAESRISIRNISLERGSVSHE